MPEYEYILINGNNKHTGKIFVNSHDIPASEAERIARGLLEDWLIRSNIDIYSLGNMTTLKIGDREYTFATADLLYRIKRLIKRQKVNIDKQLSDL